jgi:hypothetical protein
LYDATPDSPAAIVANRGVDVIHPGRVFDFNGDIGQTLRKGAGFLFRDAPFAKRKSGHVDDFVQLQGSPISVLVGTSVEMSLDAARTSARATVGEGGPVHWKRG